ncbi:MAG TPA: hypothetical protein DF409_06215 [Bacteroidales bacterium]|jgi:signal transduction histidine kinase|nr:hypothetical protein [Bacteroidales bacterium]
MSNLTNTLLADFKPDKKLLEDYKLISANSLAVSVLNGIPTATIILNPERELVFANSAFLKLYEIRDIRQFLGFKPGDLMGCQNLKTAKNGCGTSDKCKVCAALKSIRSAIETGAGAEEGIFNTQNGTLNLQVDTEKIIINNREFILMSLQDISSEKKRLLLERIFYHDILNTAHNISGMVELLASGDFEDSREEFLGMLLKSSSRLIDEINTHRLISYDQFIEQINPPETVNSMQFIDEMFAEFKPYTTGQYDLILDKRSEDFNFSTQKVILKRVITNMIKNAFEAEDDHGPVTTGIIPLREKGAMLWVHNPSYMNEDIQLQVFNRSFSTKGNDRGLGTYSMKLLTEKYLKGKIYFTSTPSSGTTFMVEISG